MQYVGSKNRYARGILAHMPPVRYFVEPFVGGGNMTYWAVKSGKFQNFLCSDANEYVIAYFNALKSGWMPKEDYSLNEYLAMKKDYDIGNIGGHSKEELCVVGNCMGFMGGFFNVPCLLRDHTKSPRNRDKYPFWCALKDREWVDCASFTHTDYQSCFIPDDRNCVIYLDPPYQGTKKYKNVDPFSYDAFYDWVREKSMAHYVYTSELSMPEDFDCIWSKERNGSGVSKKQSIERLFVYKHGLIYKPPNLFN